MHQAELLLATGTEPGEPGTAVTVALCGYWAHEGPCRWPHNSAISAERGPARFRTLFVAEPADELAVRDLIAGALASDAGWSVRSSSARAIEPSERDLAERLLSTRLAAPS